jgi:outer membrane protein
MKKILTSALLASFLLGTSASADFTRIEMGAGLWQQNSSGVSTYTDSTTGATGTDTVIDDTMNKAYLWVLIKHPIPIVPNLKLEYTSVEYNGVVTGSLEDFIVPDGYTSNSHLTMDEYDIIPYYNLLDNTFWVTLDIGLDIRILDADYEAGAINVGGINVFDGYTDSSTVVIPLGYLRARVEIPTTNIGLEGDIRYITYDGSSIIDARAKIDYTFDVFPVIEPGIEIGYRYQNYDLDDNEGTKSDLTFDGFYAGVNLKF